jgi:medium-chain acyl-[acyl-carrier-protein] hydrolase
MSSRRFSNDWILVLKPVACPRVRLFCFPHGGGSSSSFNAWPERLPQDVEVCAIQLPGRGRRLLEAPMTSISQIIEALFKSIKPFEVAPIALFGHSLGALLAFELARWLQSKSIPLLHLLVSGQSAPQLPDLETQICNLSDPEFIYEVRQRYGGLPEEVMRDEEMLRLILPAMRADFMIKEAYRYQGGPALECPVSCFGGLDDPVVRPDDLAAWRDRTSGKFNLRMFPGEHFFIESSREPALKYLITELESSLRKRDR